MVISAKKFRPLHLRECVGVRVTDSRFVLLYLLNGHGDLAEDRVSFDQVQRAQVIGPRSGETLVDWFKACIKRIHYSVVDACDFFGGKRRRVPPRRRQPSI